MMGQEPSGRFRRMYRLTLLLVIGIWRILFFVLSGESPRDLGQATLLIAWPTLPYVLLAWLFTLIKSPWIVAGVTAAFLVLDALSSIAILHPNGSTAGLAVLFMPLWQVIIVLPGGIAFDWFVRWGRGGFRIGRKNRDCSDNEFEEDETDDMADE